MSRRVPEFVCDAVCGWCPALGYPVGGFDVASRPDGQRWPWNAEEGLRRDAVTGVPVCVHPDNVGLPPGRYGSEGIEPDTSRWDNPDDWW